MDWFRVSTTLYKKENLSLHEHLIADKTILKILEWLIEKKHTLDQVLEIIRIADKRCQEKYRPLLAVFYAKYLFLSNQDVVGSKLFFDKGIILAELHGDSTMVARVESEKNSFFN